MRLQLHALAYNLATFLRCIELPEAMAGLAVMMLSNAGAMYGSPLVEMPLIPHRLAESEPPARRSSDAAA